MQRSFNFSSSSYNYNNNNSTSSNNNITKNDKVDYTTTTIATSYFDNNHTDTVIDLLADITTNGTITTTATSLSTSSSTDDASTGTDSRRRIIDESVRVQQLQQTTTITTTKSSTSQLHEVCTGDQTERTVDNTETTADDDNDDDDNNEVEYVYYRNNIDSYDVQNDDHWLDSTDIDDSTSIDYFSPIYNDEILSTSLSKCFSGTNSTNATITTQCRYNETSLTNLMNRLQKVDIITDDKNNNNNNSNNILSTTNTIDNNNNNNYYKETKSGCTIVGTNQLSLLVESNPNSQSANFSINGFNVEEMVRKIQVRADTFATGGDGDSSIVEAEAEEHQRSNVSVCSTPPQGSISIDLLAERVRTNVDCCNENDDDDDISIDLHDLIHNTDYDIDNDDISAFTIEALALSCNSSITWNAGTNSNNDNTQNAINPKKKKSNTTNKNDVDSNDELDDNDDYTDDEIEDEFLHSSMFESSSPASFFLVT